MTIFLTTLETVAVLLVIGLLGFVLISRRVLPETVLAAFSRLALEIALPALILTRIITNFSPAQNPGWWHLPLWFIAFTASSGVLTALCTFLAKPGYRREFALALFYPNAVFVPLVLLSQRYGTDSQQVLGLFFYTLLFSPLYFSTCGLFYADMARPTVPWRRLLHPAFIVSAAGILLCLTGSQWLVPGFVLQAARQVGNMAVVLLLIVLGGAIYIDLRDRSHLALREIIVFVLVKNFLFPAVALIVIAWVQPPPSVAVILAVQSAVPPITSLPIMAARAGGNRALLSQFLVASFGASLVTIPLVLTALAWIVPGI